MTYVLRLVDIQTVVIVILLQFSIETLASIFSSDQGSSLRKHRSKEVRNIIKFNANPCEDFFEYACGNWSAQNESDDELDNVTPINTLSENIDTDLKRFLGEQNNADDTNIIMKAKDFYKTCLAADKNGHLQQKFFSDFIKINNGFPAVPGSNWKVYHHDYNWVEVVSRLKKNYGMNILIGTEVDTNYANTQENSIYLGEPSTIIPTKLCNKDKINLKSLNKEAFTIIKNEISENLKLWLGLTDKLSMNVATDIIAFELKLCSAINISTHKLNDPFISFIHFNYHRSNLIEISHMIGDKINFLQYMNSAFGLPIYKPVYLTSPAYFYHLVRTIENTDKMTLANYIMYHALSLFSFPLLDKPFKRSKFCLTQLKMYLPNSLDELYLRQFASETIKSNIFSLFSQLKTQFKNSLTRDWIEERTRRIGLKKLNDIILFFPTNDSFLTNNILIDKNNYWISLAVIMSQAQELQIKRLITDSSPTPLDQVYAYETRIQYRALQQRIDIGWGLLRPPFYHLTYGYSILYSTIGQLLAQQILSAFDDVHWSHNTLGIDMWDAQTEKSYRNRSHCFKSQIGNYLYNDPLGFENDEKLKVLISLSSSVRIAFETYLNWLRFQSPNNDFAHLLKETLPELNFSNTQLFFVIFAQMHCQNVKRNNTSVRIYSTREIHSLERFAINGPLLNLNEFALEFNCKVGEAMNPYEKCIIY